MSIKVPLLQLKGHSITVNPVFTCIKPMLPATPRESPQTSERRIVIDTMDVFTMDGQCKDNNVLDRRQWRSIHVGIRVTASALSDSWHIGVASTHSLRPVLVVEVSFDKVVEWTMSPSSPSLDLTQVAVELASSLSLWIGHHASLFQLAMALKMGLPQRSLVLYKDIPVGSRLLLLSTSHRKGYFLPVTRLYALVFRA
ncbi:hypothetical protein BU15DRAFT_67395 [Melanogaster broomeanus]|nr:hypothetical protein BU15DRAFT_67395 [Melanogaster broomeanus]